MFWMEVELPLKPNVWFWKGLFPDPNPPDVP
jgi:hypothetical protein